MRRAGCGGVKCGAVRGRGGVVWGVEIGEQLQIVLFLLFRSFFFGWRKLSLFFAQWRKTTADYSPFADISVCPM